MNLLSIVALATAATSLGVVLFQIINLLVPDPLGGAWAFDSARSSLRFSISSLIVAFPVYLAAMAGLAREPEKRNLPIRKWLTYLTLFVAAVIIMGDLIALINGYLGGELTLRFVLKIFAILAVAGSVFSYYLADVRREGSTPGHGRTAAYVASIFVLAALVAGFFIAGSPAAERARRFDEQRLNDLRSIQWRVVSHWQVKGTLPKTLSDLATDIDGFSDPKDPETGISYRYVPTGERSFELCAVFARAYGDPSAPAKPVFGSDLSSIRSEIDAGGWAHPAGEACFSRTIDPDLYPPVKR